MPAAYSNPTPPTTRRAAQRASATSPARSLRPGHLNVPAATMTPYAGPMPGLMPGQGGYALPAPATPYHPYPGYDQFTAPNVTPAPERTEYPDVWLISLATPAGGFRPIEGAGRSGAVKVSRPYGHLRAMRPVMPEIVPAATPEPEWARVWAEAAALAEVAEANARAGRPSYAGATTNLPAERLIPQVVSAVEVETDAGIFRVERRDDVLTHSDLAWSVANLESGEPDSVVPLPRRQL